MDTNSDNEIDFENYSDLQFEKNLNNGTSIPVYGPFEKLYLSDWGQSKIHHSIMQAFNKMNIKQMHPIQKYSILYLMNNYNTAMVGFAKGKSTLYLTSIFSLLMKNTDDELTKSIGPIAIVLTNSIGSSCILEKLSKKLNFFAKTEDKIGVVVADASTPTNVVEAALCNGCKILITTPTYLNNLLKKLKLFSWSKLKHFVFDNLDLLLENYKDEMIGFFKILQTLKDKKKNIQFISTSVRWTKDVDEFLKVLFVKWQYVFGSHLEAAHYMNIGLTLTQVKNDKLEKILQCLMNNIKYGRSVLITSNPDELLTISSYFQQNDFNLEVLSVKQLKSAKIHTIKEWNSPLVKNQRLLICSDAMLLDYYIDEADNLIHYDIPIEKHTFSIRFSVLQDSKTIFEKKQRHSYIFLSDSTKDMLQFTKVVEVMKVFGDLNPILLKHAKNINDNLEKAKIGSLFCDSIQQFGFCPNQLSCKYRHILQKEIDEPAKNIPKSGLAIIKILNVYDATHMTVKLLKLNHTNSNDAQNWLNVDDYSSIIKHELNSFYSNPNKVLFTNAKPGDIVAVELNIKFRETINAEYFRAIVIDLVDLNPVNSQVIVKLIDEGYIETVSKWKIFELPDKYKTMPTTTVDMYVSSVKPIEFDKVWCAKANFKVKKRFLLAENYYDTVIVNVKLALGTTIWVSKIYRMHNHEVILPDLLLHFGYADLNFEHLDKLTELCTSAGIYQSGSLKKYIQEDHKLSKEEFMSLYKLPQPQWAHLDKNVDNLVSVEYIISPKCFFLRSSKFLDCLNDLNKKINKYIEQKQVEKLKHIVKGAIGLGQYPSTNEYCRVQIYEILNKTHVEVLFVDIGEFHDITINSLLTIHPNLIIPLPFQAIECCLNGVIKDALPSDSQHDELVDFMFNMTQDTLYSKVINTCSAEVIDGNCYEIILYSENININLEMYSTYNLYFDCDEILNQLNNLHVNNNMSENNDYEDSEELIVQKPYVINIDMLLEDMEREDIYALQDLANQLGMTTDIQKKKKEPHECIEEVKKPSNHDILKESTTEITSETAVAKKDLEGCIIEPLEETTSVDSTTKTVLKKKTKLKLSVKHHRTVCLTCNNFVRSTIVPKCTWYQNKNNIFIKFNILEVDNFSLNCTPDSITFKAQFQDTFYSFSAKLFSLIDDQNVTHTLSFQGFQIKVEKLYKTDYKWPRLLECHNLHKYIIYDPEHIESKCLFSWLNAMNTFKLNALGESLSKSDVESSDSEEYDTMED